MFSVGDEVEVVNPDFPGYHGKVAVVESTGRVFIQIKFPDRKYANSFLPNSIAHVKPEQIEDWRLPRV